MLDESIKVPVDIAKVFKHFKVKMTYGDQAVNVYFACHALPKAIEANQIVTDALALLGVEILSGPAPPSPAERALRKRADELKEMIKKIK